MSAMVRFGPPSRRPNFSRLRPSTKPGLVRWATASGGFRFYGGCEARNGREVTYLEDHKSRNNCPSYRIARISTCSVDSACQNLILMSHVLMQMFDARKCLDPLVGS